MLIICSLFLVQSLIVFSKPIKFAVMFTFGNILAVGRWVGRVLHDLVRQQCINQTSLLHHNGWLTIVTATPFKSTCVFVGLGGSGDNQSHACSRSGNDVAIDDTVNGILKGYDVPGGD